MPTIRVLESRVIPAPPQAVYDILADYDGGHRRILPPRIFPRLEVEAGGKGAGTRIRFQMKVLGTRRDFRALITEPGPFHLVETDLATGAQTTFRVEPVDQGLACRVTLETSYERDGLQGLLESWTAPSLLRRIFREELQNLQAEAAWKTA